MSQSENEVIQRQVPLVWDAADGLQSVFCNQVFVTHAGNAEFSITFGELYVPPTYDYEAVPAELMVKPVARIVVSAKRMREIVNAIAHNLETYEKKQAALKESSEQAD